MSLILASGSPRRRMLLTAVGVELAAVCPPDVIERPHPGEDPVAYVRRLAREKASAVDAPGSWVLAADTTVYRDGRLFEKPADGDDAERMLLALSDGWHRVSTGWCLRWGGAEDRPGARLEVETTRVRFRPLTAAQVRAYVAGGESLDKAGAYGIQGRGAALVAEVRGSHSNVVGLPLDAVLPALQSVGLLPGAPTPPEKP